MVTSSGLVMCSTIPPWWHTLGGSQYVSPGELAGPAVCCAAHLFGSCLQLSIPPSLHKLCVQRTASAVRPRLPTIDCQVRTRNTSGYAVRPYGYAVIIGHSLWFIGLSRSTRGPMSIQHPNGGPSWLRKRAKDEQVKLLEEKRKWHGSQTSTEQTQTISQTNCCNS